MIGCVSLSLKWQRNQIWWTGGADFAFRRTRWMWRETFRHIRVEKGFCFSSYLQGRHNKWLEMMLVIFFDPAVFLDYSTACNLFCHSFKCNSVCLGWQRSFTRVWGWANYIPHHWTPLNVYESVWWIGYQRSTCNGHFISWVWTGPTVCIYLLLCVENARECLVYSTLLCFTILGLLKVCLQNSFIPHKLQSQCSIELLTET